MPALLLSSLDEILEDRPNTFLQPSTDLYASTIQHVQQLLDPLARSISEAQTQRDILERQDRKRKRKTGYDTSAVSKQRRIAKIHTEGFEVEQIWAQAKLVLEGAMEEVERDLPALMKTTAQQREMGVNEALQSGGRTSEVHNDGFDSMDSLDESAALEQEEEAFRNEQNGITSQKTRKSRLGDGREIANDLTTVQISDDEEMDSDDDNDDDNDELGGIDEDDDSGDQRTEDLVKDKHGLNDGFFSIDQFNKQTQFLENQDARGDPDDGMASDEESVDWNAAPSADPPSQNVAQGSRKKPQSSFDEDEEGPAPFGDMDLNAPEGESEDDDLDAADADMNENGMNDFSNTNDIKYKDFFAPPAQQKQNKAKSLKSRPNGRNDLKTSLATEKTGPDDYTEDSDEDAEVQRAMSNVHSDLFDDDEDDLDASEAESKVPDSRNLSNHEKRQLALREEIDRLERENVARKDWTLAGETVAPSRPVNSLLAEDLDFERAGKPVPIPTTEVDEDIEALIRRRILDKEFNEVIRRRPTELVTGPDPRRGRLRDELADSKPSQGLAAEYEDDYFKKSDPNYVDKRSEEQKAVHAKIEAQWKDISAQLDALSNWHYKPRPPTASLDVRTDAPVISMEDARPSAGGTDGLATSALAPQEVFNVAEAHKNRRRSEILPKGSTAVVNREEEGRDAAKRRRNREKARQRKANAAAELSTVSNKSNADNATRSESVAKGGGRKKERDEVVGQLKKGGVKLIGKKGRLSEVDGAAAKDGSKTGSKIAGNYKL
ncbi:MAG: U3 snoRNP protein [Chrysothrix sp. TS-e1954]|nr:MAG: U3 snoRNP protein [Chrysothrix sp. TS-e1954]